MAKYLDIDGTRYLLDRLHSIMDDIAVGDINLNDYVTKVELQEILDGLGLDVDTSKYVTVEDLERALDDLDLSDYATKDYVIDAINQAELGGGDGEDIDLSIYAKKSDLNGYATETYVDDAIANAEVEIDLSEYATVDYVLGSMDTMKEYVDNSVDGVAGESAYEVYLNSRGYRCPQYGEIIEAEDNLYIIDEDTETHVKAEDYIRCKYNNITSMLDELVTLGYTDTEVDLVHCGTTQGTVNIGDYFYRFKYETIYDEELGGNVEKWVPYLATVTDITTVNNVKKYIYSEEQSYYEYVYVEDKNPNNIIAYTKHLGIKVTPKENARKVVASYSPLIYATNEVKAKIHQIYLNMMFNLKQLYITEEEWLESLKGETVLSFEDLTEEQKASLKGDKGDKGDQGEQGVAGNDGQDGITPHIDSNTKHWFIGTTDTGILAEGVNGTNGTNGVDGQNGQDGYTPVRGTDYWTENDIATIKAYIDTELGVIENGSY